MRRVTLEMHERKKMAAMGIAAIIAFFTFWATTPARAHDQWADGSAIPAWVKSACCGPQDAHVIDSGDVTGPDKQGFYHVKDVGNPVPGDHVFDSQDGQVWAFYNPYMPPKDRYVYCLFLSRSF